MTNLLAAITVSILVTNTTTLWPSHLEGIPCPDRMIGCTVFHGKTVYDTNGDWRTNVVTVRRLELVSIPEINFTKTNKNVWVSEVHTPQKRIELWDNQPSVVLPESYDWNDQPALTNLYFSAIVLTNASLLGVTNYAPKQFTVDLNDIKSFKTNGVRLEIELK